MSDQIDTPRIEDTDAVIDLTDIVLEERPAPALVGLPVEEDVSDEGGDMPIDDAVSTEDDVDPFEDEEDPENRMEEGMGTVTSADFSEVSEQAAEVAASDDGDASPASLDVIPEKENFRARLQKLDDGLATLSAIVEEAEQVRKSQADRIAERFDQLSAAVAVRGAEMGNLDALALRLNTLSEEAEKTIDATRKVLDEAVAAYDLRLDEERARIDEALAGVESRLAAVEARVAQGFDAADIVRTVTELLNANAEKAAAKAAAKVIREELANL